MGILVNGQVKELSIIDPKTGVDWSGDLLGNNNAYDGYDDEQEMPIMSEETFDWWANYIEKEQDLQDRYAELKSELDNDDAEKFEQEMIDAGDSDLEMMQMAQVEVVESWEEKNK